MDIHKNSFSINFLLISITLSWATYGQARMNHCYVTDGTEARRCLPPFVNAAFGKTVAATDTCGSPEEEFCLQTGVTGVSKSCHNCNSSKPSLRHDATFLTDFNNVDVTTWWQSRTMLHEVQYPNMVNLTLNLNKAFDITYVRLLFHTSRPESFAIYKKKCEECDWQPFQYYSGSCFTTYGIDNKEIVTVENEQKPLCTDDFSDISPLTGGNVAFSTLESRPSAYNFDQSPVLQDWVKAVAIRITLNRINTFGDEVFRDPKILRSYYYAISDLSIGGRCACNGHASECFVGPNDVLQCRCEHNTAGRDCEKCADMFNDRPWTRGTQQNPGECKECDCSGKSETCYFDMDLYQQTGSGGHCTGCRDHTDGPRCAYCEPYFYRNANDVCEDCECDSIGSLRRQCGSDGRCFCRPGVGGAKCDRCLPHHYGLNEAGCRPCQCSEAGTVEGTMCDSNTGSCVCKLNVEGVLCDSCIPSTMNLQASNPYGCTACFCYGHSSVCEVSQDYTVAFKLNEFTTDVEDWEGRNSFGGLERLYHDGLGISMDPGSEYRKYFAAPAEYLGVQRFSYNQFLEFELYVEEQSSSDGVGSGSDDNSIVSGSPSDVEDIILEGEGIRVTASITSQGNLAPGSDAQIYRFRLHEAADFYPRISAVDFQKMLNNLDKIYIASSYGEGTVAHLDNVQLKTAERNGAGPRADWVERCDLDGYRGESLKQCAPGYTRDPPNGGVYAQCVPCNCNGHSATCDPNTGVCVCLHNTVGDNCELCEDGYYFGGDESRRGTPSECQPCPCPERSACAFVNDDIVVCTNCPSGHAGPQCEICMDGWFGEPRGRGPCLRCMCNGNIDENAVMNCNRTTGECMKCIHNTTGFHCEGCLPGYFGKAITANPDERCRLCDCNSLGSHHVEQCNTGTGQCQCLSNVEGRKCDRCRSGYWDLASGGGCQSCDCHPIGSSTGKCNEDSGQCECLPGVTGQRCDQCQPGHFGLNRAGCAACDCNPDGSLSLQCGDDGRCECKEGVFGVKCDQCQENFFDLVNGCKECPTCYSLVQGAVNDHRSELARLEDLIENIGEQPLPSTSQGNDGFRNDLAALNKTAHELLDMGNKKQKAQDDLLRSFDDLNEKLRELVMKLAGVEDNVDHCNETVQEAKEYTEGSRSQISVIRESLQLANEKLKQAMMDLNAAQQIADDSLNKENNMSRLAQEAQDITNRHQATAKHITDTAQEAYDLSRRAQELIQESIDQMDGLITSLEDLIDSENKIPAARKLREDLLAQSGVVKNDTKAAKNLSTDLFTATSKLTLPEVDVDAMDQKSQLITTDSENLMSMIDSLEQDYRNNYGELKTEADKARDLIGVANAAQNTADMLLAQADAALDAGQMAVKRGNKTYHSLLDTIESLESFDDEITSNRDDAEAALENVDEIQRKIDEAKTITDQAKASLGTARKIATQANEKAQQAMDIAEGVQQNAQEIRSTADASHGRAGVISEAVTSLEEDLLNTEASLNEAEQQAQRDVSRVDEATSNARAAKRTAQSGKRRVNSVLRQLQELFDRINTMEDVNDDEIGRLEIMYEDIRRDVEEADTQSVIDRLRKDVNQNRRVLRFYDSHIDGLRTDISNLEEIRRSIPNTCSARSLVEQP